MKKLSIALLVLVCSASVFARPGKEPCLMLAGKIPAQVTKAQLIAQPVFTDANGVMTVKDFSVTVIPKGKELYGPFKAKGDKIPENVISYIKKYSSTPMNIIIEDMHVEENSDKVIRTLASIFLKYKE